MEFPRTTAPVHGDCAYTVNSPVAAEPWQPGLPWSAAIRVNRL